MFLSINMNVASSGSCGFFHFLITKASSGLWLRRHLDGCGQMAPLQGKRERKYSNLPALVAIVQTPTGLATTSTLHRSAHHESVSGRKGHWEPKMASWVWPHFESAVDVQRQGLKPEKSNPNSSKNSALGLGEGATV